MNKQSEIKRVKNKLIEGIIMFCKLRQNAIDEEIGDCGTDENGRCIGYAENTDEPHDKCKECRANVCWEDEDEI